MECLPNELIEYILKSPNLSFSDIVSFSSTSSKFREVVTQSSAIWKNKYFQRWPKTDLDIVVSDWYSECITRRNLERRTLELLSVMSSKFYDCSLQNIKSSQLDFAIDLVNSHKYGYFYVRDFLIEIKSLPLSQSLTNKYYGSILLKHINKRHYTEVWNNLLQLDIKEQTLEKGAIFVSYWFRDNESGISEAITSDLDHTAYLAKQFLLQVNQNHPLKSVPEETQLKWKNENIPGNMFEPHHCRRIIEAISYVLFEQLKYHVIYGSSNLERRKYCIDYAVLDRQATALIFAVIYESVARRLGVKIEILEFLDHCLLRWKEHYDVEDSPYHYISMSSKGLIMKTRSCPSKSFSNVVVPPCNMQHIAQKAAFSIYSFDEGEVDLTMIDVLELSLLIRPVTLEFYEELGRCYIIRVMDAQELLSKIFAVRRQMTEAEWSLFQPLLGALEAYQKAWERDNGSNNKPKLVQQRVPEIKFAVGMIVRDKQTDRIGVIYGWDTGVRVEGNPSEQTLYKVLIGDGSHQYVPQGNLQILHSPPFISHISIGRFFDEYCTTYYKPNKELQLEYPEDMEVLQQILRKDREI